ncbi:hypothetical protein DFH28DRAFT_966615 [Melampsora americana]|nr:hypothetical protein DFH28DRAFT_966615 [Melampsora americana]
MNKFAILILVISLTCVSSKPTPRRITNLEQQPICKAWEYGNCVRPIDPTAPLQRPCTCYNRCRRSGCVSV